MILIVNFQRFAAEITNCRLFFQFDNLESRG